MSPNGQRVKLKRARLLLDEMHSVARGWHTRFVPGDRKTAVPGDWQVLADYPTAIRQRPQLGAANQQRIDNMRLCCGLLDGLLLRPREVFSLQHLIGEATVARGFAAGPIIVGGRLQAAVGGGLCQVSTALFNVALLANFTILQKYNHSTDIWGEERLVSLGRDAAYVFARRDLKFENSHAADAVLRLRVSDDRGTLACSLWSPDPLPVKVQVDSTVLAELPSPVRGGRPGWRVLTVRTVCDAAGAARITYTRTENYQPERK